MNTCPVCGNDRFRKISLCTDHFLTGEQFPILQCDRCLFRMTGSPPVEEEAGRYYHSDNYISHSDIRKGWISKAYHLARKQMLNRKFRIVVRASGREKGTLLDLGAGTGYFLRTMQNKGWQVTGTEKEERAREVACSQGALRLLPAEDFFSLPPCSFDVITLWHVMEHLHNLEGFWNRFPLLLKPEGTLVIALPNPGSADARHYGEFWAAWDVPRHLWHFTPDNIRQLAGKAGFVLKSMHRLPFDAFYISILSEKYRRSSFPVPKGIFHGMVSWMASLFHAGSCSSLVYVFKTGAP